MAQRFDPFTPTSKLVLNLAEHEARQFQHTVIDTDHVVLGLMLSSCNLAARALRECGFLDPPRARAWIGQQTTRQPGEPEIFTDDTRRLLEFGVLVAQEQRARSIYPEHLLLGVLRMRYSAGYHLLTYLESDVARLRPYTLSLIYPQRLPFRAYLLQWIRTFFPRKESRP